MRLLTELEKFNRKERFCLVGWALDNPNFRLGESFRQQLSARLNLQIPPAPFVGMDYHLEWLYASLIRAATPEQPGPFPRAKLISGHPGRHRSPDRLRD